MAEWAPESSRRAGGWGGTMWQRKCALLLRGPEGWQQGDMLLLITLCMPFTCVVSFQPLNYS